MSQTILNENDLNSLAKSNFNGQQLSTLIALLETKSSVPVVVPSAPPVAPPSDDGRARIERIEGEIRTLKQRAFRFGASSPEESFPDSGPQLTRASAELQTWLTNPRGRKSAISLEVPFKVPKLNTKAVITNAGGSVYSPGPFGPQQSALRLQMLLPEVPLALGAGVEYSQETSYVPGAGIVPEGTIKPTTDLVFTLKTATIKTIATITKVSVQSLSDVPDLRQWIDTRLAYAVMLKSEDVFLNATPDGLLAVATALHADYTPGGTGATGLDFIAGGVSQLESQGYSPDAIVVSGPDSFAMRLSKTVDGAYILASPDSSVGIRTLWSVPLIVSPSIAKGSFLVGALFQSTVLFSRQRLSVEIAFENEDDFARNLCCIRAEERNTLAVVAPSGIVKGTLPAGTPAAFAAKGK